MNDTIGINQPNKILNNKPKIEIIEVDISSLCPSGKFIWLTYLPVIEVEKIKEKGNCLNV